MGTEWRSYPLAALGALDDARQMQDWAARQGFDWPEMAPLWAKLDEEIAELRAAVAQGEQRAVLNELGDVLFTVVNLARRLKVDPGAALQSTNAKFVHRLGTMQLQAGELELLDLETLEQLWQSAKDSG